MNIKELNEQLQNGYSGLVDLTAKVLLSETKKTKSDKEYLQITLMDKTGTITMKKWDKSLADDAIFAPNNVLKLERIETNLYNGVYSLQAKLATHEMVVKNPDMREYAFTIIPPMATMKQELIDIVNTISNSNIKRLCQLEIETDTFQSLFWSHPAANKNHHAETGGLLYHTLTMMKSARAICQVYDSNVNQSIVLGAILFHDIGKLEELAATASGAGEYTRYGLLGHIYLGAEKIHTYLEQKVITEEEYLQLAHCVLSHHGQIEWGSPIVPATKEAMLVHFIDNIDAKMFVFDTEYLKMDTGQLSQNSCFVLNGARPYKPNKLEGE